MCGRFALVAPEENIRKRFQVDTSSFKHIPRYNISPGQKTPIITSEEPTTTVLAEWGIQMPWQKETTKRLINTRAETVAEKPFFKKAFEKQRCLVIADGFYEWKPQKTKKIKAPYRILLENEELFAFAGIYRKEKNDIFYSILTTNANTQLKPIHPRMPVILEQKEEQPWLDTTFTTEELLKLFNAFPSKKMKAYAISPRINIPTEDNPGVIQPITQQRA